MATIVLAVTATILTASIIGDRSATDYGGGLDYMFRPIQIARPVGFALVVASIVGYVASAIGLIAPPLMRIREGDGRELGLS